MLNKEAKHLKFPKKFIALIILSTIALSSGTAFTNLINPIQSATLAAGTLYTRYDNQTQYLVDGDNMIIENYVMNAEMNYTSGLATVSLRFVLPGYDPNNLRFFVFPQAQPDVGYKEYVLDNETQMINLSVSKNGTEGDVDSLKVYEVHVYNNDLNGANFIGKAKFVVINDFARWGSPMNTVQYPLLDANGTPIKYKGHEQNLIFAKANVSTDWVSNKVICAASTEMLPFDARSIKVVVFASNPEYRYYKTINIDKYMYPFYQNERISLANSTLTPYPWLIWTPDIMDLKSVDGQPVEFEFHFYKDNVLEENFLCKSVGVKLPPR